MGLDMYAYMRKQAVPSAVDFDSDEGDTRIFYWRKHHNLHDWMEKLYRQKGGDSEFNCANLLLTREDIDRLEEDVLADRLPETKGSFFGLSTAEDQLDDRAFIALARQEMEDDHSVYYSSWW